MICRTEAKPVPGESGCRIVSSHTGSSGAPYIASAGYVAKNREDLSVFFRRANPADADVLTALALRSKRVWGYDDGFMALVLPDMVVHPEFLRDEYGLVAEEGGKVVGYTIVRIDSDSAFLRDLFVDPDRFRQGIGKALFTRASNYARDCGAKRIRLGGDPNAMGFYKWLGMVQVGEEPSIVGGGRMLPIMELDL